MHPAKVPASKSLTLQIKLSILTVDPNYTPILHEVFYNSFIFILTPATLT